MNDIAVGVIAPHPPIMVDAVGGERATVTRTSLETLARIGHLLDAHRPDALVLMSPHAPHAYDAFLIDDSGALKGDLGRFGASSYTRHQPGDPVLARAIIETALDSGVPAISRTALPGADAGDLDHGALVPLDLLGSPAGIPLVIISQSGLSLEHHRRLGGIVARVGRDQHKRVVFIASGDCSHRLTPDAPAGYTLRGAEFDALLVEIVRSGVLEGFLHIDPDLAEAAGECGLRSFAALAGFMGSEPVDVPETSYEGPWGVGYLSALVRTTSAASDGPEPPRGRLGGTAGSPESPIVTLARETIDTYVRTRRIPEPQPLEAPGLPERAGAFVSLHLGGELRGCIGTIAPTRRSLTEEIVDNAIKASTQDPRFPEVRRSELPELEIKVDVLHEPEPCTRDDLDPSVYGVIVSSGHRRGLLLPDLEGVDDVDTQIAIATRKAGISPAEPVSLMRFKVDRYT